MHALAAVLLLLLVLPAPLAAQQAREHEIKAAFLFKFPAFVEWPEAPAAQASFVIGVVAASDVADALRALARGRTLHGRPIEVREVADAEALDGAQMVFVGRGAAPRLPALARALAGRAVLLVAESPGALDEGAALNFVLSEGRVRFDAAVDAAEARDLRISARLLAVARSVRGGKS